MNTNSYVLHSTTVPSDEWKRVLVDFGIAITAMQRAERLVVCRSNQSELLSELLNPGHQNWDPFIHPDWLLLEIENGILIREEQAQIAKEMIVPSSGSNSIMQLNMGLGKSSVIVPIVAAELADGSQLARVVVLKSLSTQMFQLLANKLGGFLNRRTVVMPISRSLKIGLEEVVLMQKVYEDCKLTGGIVLVQPEHLLSFELLGLDHILGNLPQLNNEAAPGDHANKPSEIVNHCSTKSIELSNSQTHVGNAMIRTQKWLLEESRDILDESDELLSTRFELIYTVGNQQPIQFCPDRWIIIQHVLNLVKDCVMKQDDMTDLEVMYVFYSKPVFECHWRFGVAEKGINSVTDQLR